MSTLTGGSLNLTKPAITDQISLSIPDLANDMQIIDDEFTAHVADLVTDVGGAHGLVVEYGTFTPVLAGASVAGTNTYSVQKGDYSKIGKRIFFEINVALSAKDVAMSGTIEITGFPFACKNVADYRPTGNIGGRSNFTLDAARPDLGYVMVNGDAKIRLRKAGDNNAEAGVVDTQINNTTSLVISGNYETT